MRAQGAGDNSRGLLCDTCDVVIAVQCSEVAGDVNNVVRGATPLRESPPPHRQRPLMLVFGMRST